MLQPTRLLAMLFTALLVLAAAGCGQKGPLYLPPPDAGAAAPASGGDDATEPTEEASGG